jgi:hypothetical protein
MDKKKQRALEAAGWRLGDAADFLEMTDEERQLLDARVEAALAVRRQRASLKLTQKQLAGRIKTSQPRFAKIERAARDVSLDQILRAFAAVGGRFAVKRVQQRNSAKGRRGKKSADTANAKIQIELTGSES